MNVETQSEVIAFLSQPGSYRPAVDRVERTETHVSVIFLAGDHAYKLKRAVLLPYLDFSTAGLRRRFCERELEINRRTAPMLYQGVVPVVRTEAGDLALGGEGSAVDWLVVMARFDPEATFDRLAAAGRLDRYAIQVLADVIARFHASAAPKVGEGGTAALRAIIEGNRRSFAEFAPKLIARGILDVAAIDGVIAATEAALAGNASLLERRSSAGCVRHCHGDLHLRNVVALAGQPVLFDAIEFSDALANIDVLYDLAFLVMDLDERGHRRLASQLLNRYLDAIGDDAGLPAMPLFLALRATIRSHVEAAAAIQVAGSGDTAAEAAASAARRYLDFAAGYLRSQQPRLIGIGGLSGTGKSHLARELAPEIGIAPGARVVRTDTTRKRLAGVDVNTRLGPSLYGEEMNKRTYEAVMTEARQALAAGYSVIADAVFAHPAERAALSAIAAEARVPFDALWLEAPAKVLQERVAARRMSASDATPEVVRLQLTYDLGPLDWPRLDAAAGKEALLEAARRQLGIPSGPPPAPPAINT